MPTALELIALLAACTKDGECSTCHQDGNEDNPACDAHEAWDMPNDDAVDTLHSFIDQARAILETKNAQEPEDTTTPVTIEHKLEAIAGLLCSAFEGGSNYWYLITEFHAPPLPWRYRTHPEQMFRHLDYPLNAGGSLTIRTLEDDEIDGAKEWTLDLQATRAGMKAMAEKYPHHYADLIAENADATTGGCVSPVLPLRADHLRLTAY